MLRRSFYLLFSLIFCSSLFGQIDDYYSCWKFESNFRDLGLNNNHGVKVGNPIFISDRNDKLSSAIKLDGTNSYIRIPNDNNLSLTGFYSICFWIKPYNYGEGGFGRILEKRDNSSGAGTGLQINLNSTVNGLTFAKVGNTTVKINDCIDLNTWQFFSFTFDGNYLKVYKNGTIINTYSFPKLEQTTVDLLIGQAQSLNRAFNGEIDDIYIFNRILNQGEVGTLYNGNNDQPSPGTSNWLKSGNNLYYLSGSVGIGTSSPDSKTKLDVAGTIRADEILIEDIAAVTMNLSGDIAANNVTIRANGNTADFVFEENYPLSKLSDIESFIKTQKHLPGIPSASEMEEQGVNIAEMNKLLLQKVEELTLHIIRQQKEIDELMKSQK